ncbi:MAG: histidinol-phosphate transaminase [Alphaproteobacteria bacterium]
MATRVSALRPRPGILDITPYVGGRSRAPGASSGRVIKLASNESPLGPSPRAVAAYRAAAETLHRYPDGAAVGLRAALAGRHGVDAARIVCGNGSDELLALLARAYAGPGDEVLYSEYGFLVYPIAARAVGATPVAAPEPAYRTDVDALLAHASPRTRLVYVANPNNPTGCHLPLSELRRLRAGLPNEALLVIDAAYAEYVGAADYGPGVELVEASENVVMTRTFSKIYGLAAVRLGWAYCPSAVADVLNRIRGPFNVTGPALAAGEAALDDDGHVAAARRHNDRWLPRFSTELEALGLTVHPSVANFVLVRFPDEEGLNAMAANDFLMARGIIPRTMREYRLPDCLRITVGLEDEIEATVAALAAFMARA